MIQDFPKLNLTGSWQYADVWNASNIYIIDVCQITEIVTN